jgi:hypothetical protein
VLKEKKDMSEIKEIALSDIEKEIDYGDQWTTAVINGDKRPVEIGVKRWLSISERSRMISSIVNMCFAEDEDGRIEYRPYFETFARYYNYIAYFTNIVLDDAQNGDEAADVLRGIELLFRQTDIMEKIEQAVNNSTFWYDLMEEIDKALEYRKDVVLKASRLQGVLDAVEKLARTLGDKIDGVNPGDLLNFIGESFPGLKEELNRAYQEEMEKDK